MTYSQGKLIVYSSKYPRDMASQNLLVDASQLTRLVTTQTGK